MKHLNKYLEPISHTTERIPYSVHRSFFTEPYALYLHLHPEMEFLYVDEGAIEFFVERSSYILHAGEGIFIPGNLLHCANALTSDGSFYALVFSEEMISQVAPHLCIPVSLLPLTDLQRYTTTLSISNSWQFEIIEALKKIFTYTNMSAISKGKAASFIYTPDTDTSCLFIQGYLLIIWQYLYQNHIATLLTLSLNKKTFTKIHPTVEYIHNNYQNDISLSELAHHASMSEGQFCRVFKSNTGYTPFSYLKRYRILQSCHYLTSTNLNISEICTLCGFNNISYYNREFLRMMQMTPSQYRGLD